MIQIELFNCNTSQEALIRERYWIEQLKPTLNINNPYTSIEEKYLQKKNGMKKTKIIFTKSNRKLRRE